MPSSQDCAAPHCYNVGSMKCSGCADASYCDRDCQRADWKYHKKTCVSAQKSNCYLLRAKTPEGASSIDVAAHVEMFNLSSYGSEHAEQQELGRRLGTSWAQVQEMGKFYNQAGNDTWYYYVYAPNQTRARSMGLPKNEFASNCLAQAISGAWDRGPVYGDVAIIRSAPSQYRNVCPETFAKPALVKDIKFNLENNPLITFTEREQSRGMKVMTSDPEIPENASGFSSSIPG